MSILTKLSASGKIRCNVYKSLQSGMLLASQTRVRIIRISSLFLFCCFTQNSIASCDDLNRVIEASFNDFSKLLNIPYFPDVNRRKISMNPMRAESTFVLEGAEFCKLNYRFDRHIFYCQYKNLRSEEEMNSVVQSLAECFLPTSPAEEDGAIKRTMQYKWTIDDHRMVTIAYPKKPNGEYWLSVTVGIYMPVFGYEGEMILRAKGHQPFK